MRILVVAVHGVPQEVKLWQVNNYYRLMDNKREYIYRIEPGDADFMKRATLMSLADYILHTAGRMRTGAGSACATSTCITLRGY